MRQGVFLDIDNALANNIKTLRLAKNYSLEELANQSKISRASISRIENAEVSPTAQVLVKLCHALGISLSSLISMSENNSAVYIKHADQVEWQDRELGFIRRCVSPPLWGYKAEIIHCQLNVGACIEYEFIAGQVKEHHLLMEEGCLELKLAGEVFTLLPGDSLRYQLSSESHFTSLGPLKAKYKLVLVKA